MAQQTLEELQAVLAERIAKLDEERKINALQQAKEREAMLLEADMDRAQRLEEYRAKVAALEARKKVEEEAKEAQRIKEVTARAAEEQKQNALDAALLLQREKLERLTTAISNAEFSEEQHRKALENQRVLPSVEAQGAEVSAAYPMT